MLFPTSGLVVYASSLAKVRLDSASRRLLAGSLTIPAERTVRTVLAQLSIVRAALIVALSCALGTTCAHAFVVERRAFSTRTAAVQTGVLGVEGVEVVLWVLAPVVVRDAGRAVAGRARRRWGGGIGVTVLLQLGAKFRCAIRVREALLATRVDAGMAVSRVHILSVKICAFPPVTKALIN